MKKYLLILITTLSFGQASNQIVSFTAAQSLGFALKSGQSHITSNQCMTKSDATTKYNLDLNLMSSYTNNQLVPRSAWANGSDSEAPSWTSAEMHFIGKTTTSLIYGWSGWTDNVGIDHYIINVFRASDYAIIYTSPNLSAATTSHTATGLSPNTLYEYICNAYDAHGNQSGLSRNVTTASAASYYSWSLSASSNLAASSTCAYTDFTLTLYSAGPALYEGTMLYTNTSLTTPYNGADKYRRCACIDEEVSYKISTVGDITGIYNCL